MAAFGSAADSTECWLGVVEQADNVTAIAASAMGFIVRTFRGLTRNLEVPKVAFKTASLEAATDP
jgi:hypothetical protein